MPGPLVSLRRHAVYDDDAVRDAVAALLEPLGGMTAFVPAGSRVLLKPNLVFGRHADKAINPHPAVVRAVALLVFEAGAASVAIGDSPGFGTARSAMAGCGLKAVADELGMEIVEFTPVEHVSPDRFFTRLELAREALEADVVVNLPKMKTHGQMLMSLAVKNMFGTVPGMRKVQWHYRAGRDRLLFARAINEIAMAVKPHLSVLDAVVGMDEMGPSAGRARPVGFLAASADPWALDAAVMDVLGLERTLLFTLAAAAEHGPREWLDTVTTGDSPASLKPDDWRIPDLVTLQMHGGFVEKYLPRLASWLRSGMTPPPVPKKSCVLCGDCVRLCPAKAMRIENGAVRIDATACIRCFCCHELCQYDGMAVRRHGVLARLFGVREG